MKRTEFTVVRWFMLTVVLAVAGIPGCRRSEKAVKPTAQIPPQPTRATKATTLSKASAPSAEAVQHYQAGLKAKEAKDYATAADALSKAVKLSPDYADAHAALGWIYLAKKEKDKAIAEFQEAIRLAPESDQGGQAKEALARLGANAAVDRLKPHGPARQPGSGDPWTESFPRFLKLLGKTVGENPTWPTEGRFGVLALGDANGETIYLEPQVYPMGLADPGETIAAFKGKKVRWDLEVVKVVNDTKEKRVVLHFKEPPRQELKAANSHFAGKFAFFAAMVDETDRIKASRLPVGKRVRIGATLGFNPHEGVDLWFGVGKHQGEIALYLSLQNAVIVEG